MVQRADRGTNLQTQARQTPDVRARQHRPAASARHRTRIIAFTDCASDPLFHAETQSGSQPYEPTGYTPSDEPRHAQGIKASSHARSYSYIGPITFQTI